MKTTTFTELNLCPALCNALEACGYLNPTPVQARSIPEILAGRDVVVSAQTGTGKTAAFVLPALERLSNNQPQKKPRILILTPTRELANQIMLGLDKYGKMIQFFRVNLVGGMPYDRQIKALTRGVDVVVATPGRLMDHMQARRLDLSNVEMLILDEADRMLDMGFINDIKAIAKATPENRQTLLFSATVDKQIVNVAKQLLKNPVRIDFEHEALSPKLIKQEVYLTDSPQHKTQLLEHLLEHAKIFKAIIFTATKRGADKLADALRADGISAAPLHGDLKQNARNRTIEQMRKGAIQYLIATDVAARGIDISDITHVINYDLPKFAEDYVHRIGRTGRAGKSGVAISLALPTDRQHLRKIETYTGQKIEQIIVPGLEPRKTMSQDSDRPSSGRKTRDNFHQGKKSFSGQRAGGRSSERGDRREGGSAEGYAKKIFSSAPKRAERSERSDRAAPGAYPKKSFAAKRPERSERPDFRQDAPRSDRRTFSAAPKREARADRRDDKAPGSYAKKSFAPKRADRRDDREVNGNRAFAEKRVTGERTERRTSSGKTFGSKPFSSAPKREDRADRREDKAPRANYAKKTFSAAPKKADDRRGPFKKSKPGSDKRR